MESNLKVYNPEGSPLRELQKRLFKILLQFDKYCKLHDINYSLAYGTLLGAIRHKNFIPWDDDIDVIMTRKEFAKLEKTLKSTDGYLTEDLYIRYNLKPELVINHIGIVDIFIIDYIPKSKFTHFIKKSLLQFFQLLYRSRSYYNSWKQGGHPHLKIWLVLLPIALCKSQEYWQEIWRKIIVWKTPQYNELSCVYTAPVRYMSMLFPTTIFESYTTAAFEGYTFPVVNDYDKYLKICYGDYMTLPKKIHNHRRV